MGVPGAWALAGHRASLPQGTRTAARALLGCPCHGAPPLVIHGAEPALGTEPGRQSVALQRQRRQSRCKEGDFVFPFFQACVGAQSTRHGASDSRPGCAFVELPKYCGAGLTRKWQHLKYLHLTERPPVTLE